MGNTQGGPQGSSQGVEVVSSPSSNLCCPPAQWFPETPPPVIGQFLPQGEYAQFVSYFNRRLSYLASYQRVLTFGMLALILGIQVVMMVASSSNFFDFGHHDGHDYGCRCTSPDPHGGQDCYANPQLNEPFSCEDAETGGNDCTYSRLDGVSDYRGQSYYEYKCVKEEAATHRCTWMGLVQTCRHNCTVEYNCRRGGRRCADDDDSCHAVNEGCFKTDKDTCDKNGDIWLGARRHESDDEDESGFMDTAGRSLRAIVPIGFAAAMIGGILYLHSKVRSELFAHVTQWNANQLLAKGMRCEFYMIRKHCPPKLVFFYPYQLMPPIGVTPQQPLPYPPQPYPQASHAGPGAQVYPSSSPLNAAAVCPTCGSQLQVGWAACQTCGTSSGAALPVAQAVASCEMRLPVPSAMPSASASTLYPVEKAMMT